VATTIALPASPVAGTIVTATLTFTNNGPSTAANVTGTAVLGTVGGTISTTPFPIGTLTPGQSLTRTVTFTVPATDVSGTSTVTTTTADPALGNNTATATTGAVVASADVATTIALPASPVAGTIVTATLTFTNNGPSTAANVTGTAVLGTAGGTISTTPFPIGTLTPGQSLTRTVTFTVPATDVSGTSTITTTTADPVPANNTATATTGAVVASADVATTIQLPASPVAGTIVTATLTFTNNGPSTAADVTGTAVLGTTGGTISTTPFPLGTLTPGQSLTRTVTFTVPATDVSGTSTVTTTTADPIPANNTAATTTAVTPGADVATTIQLPVSPTAGTIVTATLTFSNTGPSTAANVTGTAVLGTAGGTISTTPFAIGNLTPGQSVTRTVTFTVPTTDVSGTSTVTTTTADNDLTNNTATALSSGITSSADLTVSKTASTPNGTGAGSTMSFVIVISNAGPSTAANVTLTDVVPTGLTVVSAAGNGLAATTSGQTVQGTAATLASGASATVTVVVSLTNTGSGTLSFSNVATGTSTTPDPTPGNNTGTSTVTIDPRADLSVTIDVPPGAVAGTIVTATITFNNNGPSTAINTTGTAVLGTTGGTISTTPFPIGTLTPGQSTTRTVTFTVPSTEVSATSTVTATTVDPTPSNNTGTDTTGVVGTLADLVPTIELPPGQAAPGTTVTATITFANNGPSTAANVTGTVVKPDGTTQTFALGTVPANTTSTVQVSYSVPPSQTASATLTFNVSVGTTTPESNTANNVASASVTAATVTNASLSGRVWLDANSDRQYQTGVDIDLTGWRAELLRGGVVIASAVTNANGTYQIDGQIPGSGYAVRFKNPAGQIIVSTPFNQTTTLASGNASTGTTTSVIGSSSVVIGDSISNVTLYAGDNVREQNLPIDPSGVVYDSVARNAVAGAVVTLIGPDGNPVPGGNLLQGASTITTDASGIYQFDLLPVAPDGVYRIQVTPPATHTGTPATQGGVAAPGGVYTPPNNVALVAIQPNATPPAQGVNGAGPVGAPGTQYFLQINFTVQGPNPSAGVIHNHIPLDPLSSGALIVTKTGNKTVAEVGDSLQYTVRLRNTTNQNLANVTVEDLLPAGFRYILETSQVGAVKIANPAGGVGRALTFTIPGGVAANTTVDLTYYVRLGVGSQQGDGINRATAVFPGVGGVMVRSNTAQFKVRVQGGVFSNEGCITGKVYVDCDGNAIQNNNGGNREVGIPGVRLVMLDGTFFITDPEGKYSVCGVKSQTHVIKVDRTTLPKGSRLVPSSNRNAGVGDSLFVDLKGGELGRADFIEGSCSPEVMDQVRARRAQGSADVPQLERAAPLTIQNRPGEVPVQILPSLRQQDSLPSTRGIVR
ncbi:MAG: CARDB domain-containing protein, partial [Polaromonas sp.]|nr:CARDB domain-containing protein [Polaromonas sp.]